MAGSMMTSRLGNAAAPRWAAAVFSFLILALSPLHAENLPDPTRPPSGIFAPASGAGTARGATAYHSSGLHLVIISKTRRAAIIDGKTVELGENHGNARLIEVNEDGVVLQRGQSRQVLTLFHGVKITHKNALGTESGEIESMDNELQVKQPSPTSMMQTEKDNSMPTEHEEGK
jgi:MSHA biogenesis protein MshK